ncbi:hydroxymethylglutaryl-CoA lyase [Franzmannia qiaohouensis]|uniref:Hydroxymethylglutaryl-CoA lyase n=1 Tax=Franzmannia qiaohouensis TaxID=1329370 RepID=A0ABU1HJV3_9GAMM|nr:hydroxymethylglutaryl-CoA lyase [Halomonas qiaohouensis]MDR5907753.1 hydroxymethylglutaryl-CoA lyase [Halomonas qiaohouensis]
MQGNNKKIFIQEVVTRDGFQNERDFVDTDKKIELINQLSQCGYSKIEVTSFTSPKAIPALRDAEQVMMGITRHSSIEYTVLVPNMRGAERALSCDADEANLVMSTSESHNLSNLKMTREASFHALSEVIKEVQSTRTAINVSLSTAFGCPMEGDISLETVLSWAERFVEQGARGITLCDTTGMAYPTQVAEVVAKFKERFGDLQLTVHLHNTRGMALSNALAAIEAGANRFDSSLGGLGGCPYAPGATGNVSTEDLVHMLELMGYRTGIDLEQILKASAQLPALVHHDVPSQILKAGRRLDLHDVPNSVKEHLGK